MVLCASYNSRAHSSILPYDHDDFDDGDVCRYEVPTSMPRGVVVSATQPISLRFVAVTWFLNLSHATVFPLLQGRWIVFSEIGASACSIYLRPLRHVCAAYGAII